MAAPSSKAAKTASTASKDRRRSEKPDKAGSIVTLHVSPDKLRAILEPNATPPVKEDSPVKESPPATDSLPPAPPSIPENVSDSTPNTPAPSGTPAPGSTMGPPVDGPKKKGVKRSAAAANGNAEPQAKIRGKPGPKSKKQRLDDGGVDISKSGVLGAHKLGPKANQGAINAGLRALDRSGKPCRKWAKGGFQLKSFTGVVWGVPRWTAPPKPRPADSATEDSASASAVASAEGENSSGKENKENSQAKSEASNMEGDTEMQSILSVPASSPAPLAIAAV